MWYLISCYESLCGFHKIFKSGYGKNRERRVWDNFYYAKIDDEGSDRQFQGEENVCLTSF